MAEDAKQKLTGVLSTQEMLLDSMLEEQSRIRDAVIEQSRFNLDRAVSDINELGMRFCTADVRREQIASAEDSLCLDEDILETLARVKAKLAAAKNKNAALAKYVSATKAFINSVANAS